MGGASSYIAMLSIAGFLGAAWTASKVSRLLGISSIVLEITVGVALGPRGFGLVDPVYTVCETKRVDDCTAPDDLEHRIAHGLPLGPTLGRIAGMDVCNPADYSHGDHGHGSHGSGLFNMTVDYVGGAQPMEDAHASDHSDGEHSSEHEAAMPMDDGSHAAGHSDSHASDSHASDSHESGHGSSHRRLSGGHYHSYSECLVKECEHEVSESCGSFPDFFTLIGHAGVGLMIFESGMHFDFEKAKIVGLPACCVAVLGTILPLIVGSALTVLFGRPFMPDGISAGTALAPTSVGIALRLLGEAGVLQENFGQAIITAAFVDDILSLVLFNVLFSLGGEFDMFKTVIAPIIGVAFMLFAMWLAVNFWPKFLPQYILARVPKKKDAQAKISAQDEALFLFMFALLFVYATITHFLGTHLWGCFIAGMSFACLHPPHHAHHVWVKQTKRVTSWMIRIFFAGTVAFTIPLQQLMSIEAFWKGSIMGIFACIGTKVVCAPFMGKARWVIGWAMVGRAEFAYLIAQMALSAGMLDAGTFSIVIWALLYATIFAPFIFRLLLNRYVASEGLGDGAAGTGFSDSDSDIWGEEKENSKKDEDDLEDIDVAGALGKNKPTEYGQSSPGGEMKAVDARAVRNADDKGKSGFLCCLFFKKVVVH